MVPLKPRNRVQPASKGESAKRDHQNEETNGSIKWGFVFIAEEAEPLSGAQAAKDAMGASMTTTGVVSALMLSFTFPMLLDPPGHLLEDGYETDQYQTWWYFQYLSVLLSFMCLFSYVLQYIYMQHIPSPVVGVFLKKIKTPWTITNVFFTSSIILALFACITCAYSVTTLKAWYAMLILTGIMVVSFVVIFLYVESNFGTFVNREMKRYHETEGQAGGELNRVSSLDGPAGRKDGTSTPRITANLSDDEH